MDTLGIPGLVTTVSSDIPVDSMTVCVEASDMNKLAMCGVSCVVNLTGMAFINSTGGTTKAPDLLLIRIGPRI